MKKEFIAFIDNFPVNFLMGQTIIQACDKLSIDIPKFCYHEKLSIAGNCRMCLVELDNSKKLVISCATHLIPNSNIKTNTLRIKRVRQSIVEFLLINHPLDCPICDQGGECDLQDISMLFGSDRGRFYEYKKKSFSDKNLGPLIKTSMNRCIHCTKCIRFISEISDEYVLGTINRGVNLEISSYVKNVLNDELSGNLIDLCPVGALTSKPYSFKYRSWELISIDTIDILDSLNSNILVDVYFNKIKRVLPYLNESKNEDWITNKARFFYDSMTNKRLNSCYLRISCSSMFFYNKFIKNDFFSFIKISWISAFKILNEKFLNKKYDNLILNLGNDLDFESLISIKKFSNYLGNSNLIGFDSNINYFNVDFSCFYLFNNKINNFFEILPSFCLLIGTNVRLESPVLNFKLKKLYVNFKIPFFSIGLGSNYLSYPIKNISNNLNSLLEIFEFKNYFCKNFYKNNFSSFPYILFGNFIFNSYNGWFYLNNTILFLNRIFKFNSKFKKYFFLYKKNINIFNCFGVISNYSTKINSSELGFVSKYSNYCLNSNSNLIYSFNSIVEESLLGIKNFLIFQGSWNGDFIKKFNLILPTKTHVEKIGHYTNIEGIKQSTRLILENKNTFVKSDWEVLKAYIIYYKFFLNKNLFYFDKIFNFVDYRIKFYSSLVEMRSELKHYFLDDVLMNIKVNNDFSKNNNINLFEILFLFSNKNNISNKFILLFLEKSLFTFINDNNKNFVFLNLINPNIINYYNNKFDLILSSSKIMNNCSLFFFKNNFSFSKYIY